MPAGGGHYIFHDGQQEDVNIVTSSSAGNILFELEFPRVDSTQNITLQISPALLYFLYSYNCPPGTETRQYQHVTLRSN